MFAAQALRFAIACRRVIDQYALTAPATEGQASDSSVTDSNTCDNVPLIGIYLDRSAAYLTAVLGCLAAGYEAGHAICLCGPRKSL